MECALEDLLEHFDIEPTPDSLRDCSPPRIAPRACRGLERQQLDMAACFLSMTGAQSTSPVSI